MKKFRGHKQQAEKYEASKKHEDNLQKQVKQLNDHAKTEDRGKIELTSTLTSLRKDLEDAQQSLDSEKSRSTTLEKQVCC